MILATGANHLSFFVLKTVNVQSTYTSRRVSVNKTLRTVKAQWMPAISSDDPHLSSSLLQQNELVKPSQVEVGGLFQVRFLPVSPSSFSAACGKVGPHPACCDSIFLLSCLGASSWLCGRGPCDRLLGCFFLGLQSNKPNSKNWLNKVKLKHEYDSLYHG